MKKLVFISILFFCNRLVYSQLITVQNQKTAEPIGFVSISEKSSNKYVLTNANGKADISILQKADSIIFSMLGFTKKTLSYQEIKQKNYLVKLKENNISINQVVISANRWRQKSSNIPSKITTITSKKAAFQNPQTAADLLAISGKVFVQKSQQGGGSPMIRGFATNRLLYIVDGVRMNTAIFRGGNIQNVISIDPFTLESTEILFGPGSVIYGSDAIGGVMSFQTLQPQFTIDENIFVSGKGVARYASANNEKTVHFDVNVGWEKWAIITSISSNDYSDLKMGTNGPKDYLKPYYVQREDSSDVVIQNKNPKIQKPSAYSQMNIMQKVRFKPNKKWDFEYGFHYSETSSYARYDRHNRLKNNFPRYGEWKYGPQKWMMNNLTISHNTKNSIYDRFSIRLAQQSLEESRISRAFNDNNRQIRQEFVEAYSANFDFTKHIGNNNQVFYGVEAVYNDVKSEGTIENISTGVKSSGPSRYPQANWASYAIYLKNQFNINEKVILQTGIRYNQYQIAAKFDTSFYPFSFTKTKVNNGALSGSLGLVYRPNNTWILRANAATAFRSPNVDDIGKVFDSAPGSVVVPNPDLQAEYAYNADIGIVKTFNDILKIDADFYYTQLQKAMVKRNYQLDGLDSIFYDGRNSQVQALQNAAVANVFGFQLGFELKLPKGFNLSSDINFQKGEEELADGSKSPSRHAAPLFGTSRLTYIHGNVKLQFYSEYQGKYSYSDLAVSEQGKTEIYALNKKGQPYAPSWYTFNFKAIYQLNNTLTLNAGMENISDQCYRPYSSGFSAAGRNFIFSMQANF